jgi:hypothetical protein
VTSPSVKLPPWSREQIRAARKIPLIPLLVQRGLALVETGGGNFQLSAFPGLIAKDSYWRWPEQNLAGNTIDFFVQVLGLSFHDASRVRQKARSGRAGKWTLGCGYKSSRLHRQ